MVYGYTEQFMTDSGILTEANYVGVFFNTLMKLLPSAEGKRILNRQRMYLVLPILNRSMEDPKSFHLKLWANYRPH
jgi:hypothetical protein